MEYPNYFIRVPKMKNINTTTLIIFGLSVFCISEKYMDLVCAIQNYWTGGFVFIILIVVFTRLTLGYSITLPDIQILKTIGLIGIFEILYAIVQLFGILPNNYPYSSFSGSLNNPAIFGMLLSFCLPISIYFILRAEIKEKRVWQIVSIIYVIFIVLSDSRTAFIAAVFGSVSLILMLNWSYLKTIINKKYVIYIGIPGIVIMVVFLYLYKQDSADGRLLIWSICLEMIKLKPISGWGIDGFNTHYMNFQANYFRLNPDSPFLLLADETKNPFNEFIHIAIVCGIPCSMLFVGGIVSIMWYIYRNKQLKHRAVLFSFILVFIIWCMFSYPLTVPFIWLILLFIIISVIPIKTCKLFCKFCYMLVTIISMLFLILLVNNGSSDIRRLYLQESPTIYDCDNALEKYEAMYNEIPNDGYLLYNYAALLHAYGYYEKSIKIFKECSKYINDYNMMLIMGDNYQKINLIDSAIIYYKRAGDMIPNRYLPLYYQMVVYQEQGKINDAKNVAKTIIHKECKIKESIKVNEIIKRANKCLEE